MRVPRLGVVRLVAGVSKTRRSAIELFQEAVMDGRLEMMHCQVRVGVNVLSGLPR